MAIFKKDSYKEVAPAQTSDFNRADLKNFGLLLSVQSVTAELNEAKQKTGNILITGVQMIDGEFGAANDVATVVMTAKKYGQFIGHGMAGNMAVIDKPFGDDKTGETRYAGSELMLDRCYKDKEGVIHAAGGIIAKQVERGEVNREYNLAPSQFVSTPQIVMHDSDGGSATFLLQKLGFNTENAEDNKMLVTLREDKNSPPQDVTIDYADFAATLGGFAKGMDDGLKNGGFKKTLTARITTFDVEAAMSYKVGDATNVEAVKAVVNTILSDLPADNALVRAASGQTMNLYLQSNAQEGAENPNAKAINYLTKFVTEHGDVEVIPKTVLNLSNTATISLAKAYAAYAGTRGNMDITYQEQWKYLKDLQKYMPDIESNNDPVPTFSQLHIAFVSNNKTNDKTGEQMVYHNVQEVVPVSNQVFTQLPSHNFTFAKKEPQAEASAAAAPAEKAKEDAEASAKASKSSGPSM